MHPIVNRQRLLERFLRYVRIGTTADPQATTYPSSSGQLALGKLLVEELHRMGLTGAHQDSHGLVWARLPGNVDGAAAIMLNAHLDTSPDAPGENVHPGVIDSYLGGDISLGDSGQVICAAQCPELNSLIGHTLVTTDGFTLLGGDDKAGVAVIMELAAHLLEHSGLPHGPIQILFTCDEEIGQGVTKVPIEQLAVVGGYTLDGSGAGILEGENFSADCLIVKALGHSIHPSIGKGRMINAVRGISRLAAALPLDRMSPESTDDRDGFLHPYSISGTIGSAELRILLRDFETHQLDHYELLVRQLADQVQQSLPGLQFEISRVCQYRNMADFLHRQPLMLELAERAYRELNIDCQRHSIRGGTDGAMFSERGIPTPNLSVGQHNLHSVLEFVSLDEMVTALDHLIALCNQWQLHARA